MSKLILGCHINCPGNDWNMYANLPSSGTDLTICKYCAIIPFQHAVDDGQGSLFINCLLGTVPVKDRIKGEGLRRICSSWLLHQDLSWWHQQRIRVGPMFALNCVLELGCSAITRACSASWAATATGSAGNGQLDAVRFMCKPCIATAMPFNQLVHL